MVFFPNICYTMKPLSGGQKLILKKLSHLGLNVLSAIQGMSAICDVRY